MLNRTTFSSLAVRILTITGAACVPAIAFVLPGCGDDDDFTDTKCFEWPNPEPCSNGSTSGSTAAGSTAAGGTGDPNAECPSAADAGIYLCRQDYYENARREGSQCCYDYNVGSGRPFLVDGTARVAEPRRAERSRGPANHGEAIRIADAWVRDGLAEHASVASFSRLALELLSLGAQLDLVRAANRAADDEVRHAETCFAIAARYGRSVEAGPLGLGPSVPLAADLEALVRSTFVEGCVGETLAAALLTERAQRTDDAMVRAALQQMAEEEAQHAELSWRIVAWACERGGDVVAASLRELLADLSSSGASLGDADDELGEVHGFLGPQARVEIERSVLRDIILPAASAIVRAG